MNELVGNHKIVASIILIVGLMIIRRLVIYYLQHRPLGEEQWPKIWISRVKNTVAAAMALGLIVIWLFELRYLALSIAAFAVALVIATREYIQCVLGSLYQSGTKMFAIGDWIKVGSHCGEVVRNDWLTTALLEVDIESNSYCYTGKTLTIPNNIFISATVTNLNFMRRYINHSFTIIRESEPVNVIEAKQLILDKAKLYCQPFADVAKRYSHMIENRLGVNIGGPEPSVRITTTNLGKSSFSISIFCPTQEAVEIEQQLIDDFMTFWYEANEKAKAAKADKSDKSTDLPTDAE